MSIYDKMGVLLAIEYGSDDIFTCIDRATAEGRNIDKEWREIAEQRAKRESSEGVEEEDVESLSIYELAFRLRSLKGTPTDLATYELFEKLIRALFSLEKRIQGIEEGLGCE